MPKKNKSAFNLTKTEYLRAIARETAKMSYPGGMSGRLLRNNKKNRAKDAIEEFFVSNFPIENLWDEKVKCRGYKKWHKQQVEALSGVIKKYKKNKRENTYFAISVKLVDTFMHQLMKYEEFRYLYKELHLPLDTQAFDNLVAKLEEIGEKPQMGELRKLVNRYKKKAFTINSDDYIEIQKGLLELVKIWNKGLSEFEIKARIELNCLLWAK